MNRNTHQFIILITVLAIFAGTGFLTSCKKGEAGIPKPSAKSFSSKTVKGPLPDMNVTGPVLNVTIETTVENLDQEKATDGVTFEVIGNLLDGLMQMAEDGSVVNAVAEKMELSSDGLRYTFSLRHDVWWSNGDPVTAHDFVYGWQRACNPELKADYSYLMSDIAHIKNAVAVRTGLMEQNQLGVRALDDYTLEVELEVPVSFFEQLLYFCTFYPANQKFIEQCGDDYGKSAENFLSNGAFILTDFKAGASKISMKKNSAYYDADKVKLGGLQYEVIKNRTEAFSKYQAGQLDLIEVSGDLVSKVRNSPVFKTVASGYLWYVSPNTQVSGLENVNLRKAMTFALDRKYITETVLADGSESTFTPVPSNFAFNSQGKDFTTSAMEFPQYCSYDLNLARQHYAQAQKELGRKTFTYTLVADDTDTQKDVANAIKRQLESALPGFTLKLNFIQKSKRLKAIGAGDYEITLTRWGPDYADPMTYLAMWVTANEYNYGRYSNSSYDAIVTNCNDGELATKPAERWTAMKQAEEIIMKDAAIFPLYQQCNSDMIRSGVKGIAFHPVGISRIYKKATK